MCFKKLKNLFKNKKMKKEDVVVNVHYDGRHNDWLFFKIEYSSRLDGMTYSQCPLMDKYGERGRVEYTIGKFMLELIQTYTLDYINLDYNGETFKIIPEDTAEGIMSHLIHDNRKDTSKMVPLENITLPDSFFDAEVRNDYFVSREKKELWAIQLDMLAKLQKVCEKHNIKWWIDAGTLLGAVRHKGFIPWDDDIDVVMLREDYDKFLNNCKEEFGGNYFLQTDWSDRVFYCHTKIRRTDTTAILSKDVPAGFDFNQGIFLDIFPLDYVPDEQKPYEQFVEHCWLLKNEMLVARSRWWLYERDNEDAWASCVSARDTFDLLRRSYFGQGTKTVANISLPSLKNEIRKSLDDFKDTFYLDFETLKVPAPSGYDNILKRLYGDYMKPVQGNSKHGNMLVDTHLSYKNTPIINIEDRKTMHIPPYEEIPPHDLGDEDDNEGNYYSQLIKE